MTGPSCGLRQNAVAPVVSCFWNNTSEQCSARPIGQACQPCALSVCNGGFEPKADDCRECRNGTSCDAIAHNLSRPILLACCSQTDLFRTAL